MTNPLKVVVHYGDDSYHAALSPDERADHLLLRSLYHFGLDPAEKGRWRLRPRDEERPGRGLYLDHAVGDQLGQGAEVVLEEDVPGNRPLSTGSY